MEKEVFSVNGVDIIGHPYAKQQQKPQALPHITKINSK